MSYESTRLPRCAICTESVNLEGSKTDEFRRAVHENCYIWTVELKKPRRHMARIEEVNEQLLSFVQR
jgi:hypothetical protein